jgi:hypothetical protein
MGEPIAGVVVPLWPRAGSVPPELDGKNGSALNRSILEIEKELYDRDTPYLLSIQNLLDFKYLFVFEREMYKRIDSELDMWRRHRPNWEIVQKFQNKITWDVIRKLR